MASGDADSGRPEGFFHEITQDRQNQHFWSACSGDGTLFGPFFFEGNIDSDSYVK